MLISARGGAWGTASGRLPPGKLAVDRGRRAQCAPRLRDDEASRCSNLACFLVLRDTTAEIEREAQGGLESGSQSPVA
jgi:hypothetical protein